MPSQRLESHPIIRLIPSSLVQVWWRQDSAAVLRWLALGSRVSAVPLWFGACTCMVNQSSQPNVTMELRKLELLMARGELSSSILLVAIGVSCARPVALALPMGQTAAADRRPPPPPAS